MDLDQSGSCGKAHRFHLVHARLTHNHHNRTEMTLVCVFRQEAHWSALSDHDSLVTHSLDSLGGTLVVVLDKRVMVR